MKVIKSIVSLSLAVLFVVLAWKVAIRQARRRRQEWEERISLEYQIDRQQWLALNY